MSRARLAGIANPMPWACAPLCGLAAASVGIPITSPEVFTSAPPLLPGLIGALVWMASGSVAAGEPGAAGSVTARPVAEMMPSVTLPDSPSGLPTASTTSPARALAGVPEPGRCQAGGVVGPDHRQVVGRVGADEPGGARLRLPGHLHLEAGRVPGHVCVGDDVALAVQDHPGAEPVGVRMSTTDGSTSRTTVRVAGRAGAPAVAADAGGGGGHGPGRGRRERGGANGDPAAADHHAAMAVARRPRSAGAPFICALLAAWVGPPPVLLATATRPLCSGVPPRW